MRHHVTAAGMRSLGIAAAVSLKLVLGFSVLAGCGQMGPLTLEEPAAEVESDPESDAEEDER